MALDVLARAPHLLQDAAAVFEQPPARLGERHAAPGAHEQGLTQFDLERAHLAAECRLHDGEPVRGAGVAAEFGDLDEVFELLQIHAVSR